MAKPAAQAREEEGQPAQGREGREHRLQGRCAAAQVHLRPRQDPRSPGDRCLGPGAAPHRQRRQERPRDGAAAVLARPADRLARRSQHQMKVILTHEVSGLGAAGDVVDVKDGYARNFLFRRGWPRPGPRAGRSRSTRSPRVAPPARSSRSRRPSRSRATSSRSRSPSRARRQGWSPLRRRLHRGHRCCRQGCWWPGARQAHDRGPDPDQDHRNARGHDPPAPRGARDHRARGRRRLIQPIAAHVAAPHEAPDLWPGASSCPQTVVSAVRRVRAPVCRG
jgi:hypothetical protein